MEKVKWLVGLLAIALFMGACGDSMATMKKAFPGRADKPAATEKDTRK